MRTSKEEERGDVLDSHGMVDEALEQEVAESENKRHECDQVERFIVEVEGRHDAEQACQQGPYSECSPMNVLHCKTENKTDPQGRKA